LRRLDSGELGFVVVAAQIGDAKIAKWVVMFTKYNPGVQVDTAGLLGMGGTEAVIDALRRAGADLTREKFVAELNKMHNFDTGMLAAPLEFSPQRHSGMTGGATITYVGDKLVIVHKFTDVQK